MTSHWMFQSYPPGSYAEASQRLSMATLRLVVIAAYRPLRPLLKLLLRLTAPAASPFLPEAPRSPRVQLPFSRRRPQKSEIRN